MLGDGSLQHGALITMVAVGVGVGIDVDHFVISRLHTGNWDAAMRCVRNPRIVFADQDAIFATGEVTKRSRLTSHLLIAAVVVGALWILDLPMWAAVVAVILGIHVVSDVGADVYDLYWKRSD